MSSATDESQVLLRKLFKGCRPYRKKIIEEPTTPLTDRTLSDAGLDIELQTQINEAKILVVGAGGIGCELLKNLVLAGFQNIEIIDLDTIDVSNLNRQFLFQKKHVKMSKAKVARESALEINPDASIVAYHDSIIGPDYGVNFFKRFKMVLNALDNRTARNHVNRLCLATGVPLIESGTAGYNGQVELILKGRTKCYECDPKPPQKTFPGCTIRNTPSEPIHCIVWAKHLFNQLFGLIDPDEDVSPDTADPEAAGEAGKEALQAEATAEGNVTRMSTRLWAQSCNYDPERLCKKLFFDDIKYLLSMHDLWKTRTPPKPLELDNLPADEETAQPTSGTKEQRVWTLSENIKIFQESCTKVKQQHQALKEGDYLEWDKDDKDAMNFVASCANIRASVFGIPLTSRFEIKSMAGNIIPAIATTNAIVAGIVAMYAVNIVKSAYDKCTTVYVRNNPNPKGLLIVPERELLPPNPKCYVCAEKPKVVLFANLNTMLVKELEEEVLKKSLNMVAPDVCIDDGTGTIIISSEEGETDEYKTKSLIEAKVFEGSLLSADDFLQEYNLTIEVAHKEKFPNGVEFEISHVGEIVQPKQEEKTNGEGEKMEEDPDTNVYEDDEDDLLFVEEKEEEPQQILAEEQGGKRNEERGETEQLQFEEEDDVEEMFQFIWLNAEDGEQDQVEEHNKEEEPQPGTSAEVDPVAKKRKTEDDTRPTKKLRTSDENDEDDDEVGCIVN